jgi:glycosyltransferase involved in cell wall biosynthesis
VALLRKIVRRERIEAIYVNGSQVLPSAAAARCGRALLFHAHWAVTQTPAASLANWALRRSEAFVIATSQFVARPLAEVVGKDRIRVIYNGVASGPVRSRTNHPPRHIAILGRVAPEKGQLEFVRAARLALHRNPGLRFTVCGAPLFSAAGYIEKVRAEGNDLPVTFDGWVEDVPAWLGGVDLLVVPSQATDNIPRVILEAFAAGVPVLAFPSGGIPELVEDGISGLLVQGRTPQALARRIEDAIENPQLLAAITKEARRRWEQFYTLRRFQSDVCGTVEEAVRLHRQRTPSLSAGTSAEA